jgi:diguanylate cyclase (GGDEF)-like protein
MVLAPGSFAQVLPPDAATAGTVRALLEHGLSMDFQPIVSLPEARVHGHEALVRGPADGPLALPEALFEAARREGIVIALEFACIRAALESWARSGTPGKLFVNLSASALISALGGGRLEQSMAFLRGCGVPCSSLVVELTEHERVSHSAQLQSVVELLRLHGVQLALDDFGDGRSSLRLWSELKPDFVKIDKYFTRGLAEDADKLQTFRALLQIAETFGAELVAEGIETTADLRVLRDLGIRYGQGWALGRPQAAPAMDVPADAAEALRGRAIAVLPELRFAAARRISVSQLLMQAPTVHAGSTNDDVFEIISDDESLHGIAVVQHERPVALIDCQKFVNRYARQFFKELYGRRSCLMFANREPLLVDLHTGIEQLTSVLTAAEQHYLREGFIITEGGRYRGLGTGQALVKAVTEARIEAARHANPLTFLPGNIPINQHLNRLLASGGAFVAAYADLNHFKAFNDYYGFWRGDEMIRLAAQAIGAQCDPRCDFLGHIGGDDFMIAFQSEDWRTRCEQITREFNARALELFDPEARSAGGIVAEDRAGQLRHHACTSMSIGVAPVTYGAYGTAEDVAAAAAAAKRYAKQRNVALYQLDPGSPVAASGRYRLARKT